MTSQRIAVYSGTFDPITLGHLDVIARATKLCDKLIVAVAKAHHKKTMFTLDERITQVTTACKPLSKKACEVITLPFDGLIVNFCKKQKAKFIVKGLRNAADLDYEAQMAQMNEKLAPTIQTVFVLPTPAVQCISSTLVREISKLNGDVSQMVAPEIEIALERQKLLVSPNIKAVFTAPLKRKSVKAL